MREQATNPLLLDHVLNILHGSVDIVSLEVKENTERCNLAAPYRKALVMYIMD